MARIVGATDGDGPGIQRGRRPSSVLGRRYQIDRGKVGSEPGDIAGEYRKTRHLSVRADEEIGERRGSNAAGAAVAAKSATGQERRLVGKTESRHRNSIEFGIQGFRGAKAKRSLRVDDRIDPDFPLE